MTASRKRRNPYTNVACQECKRRKVKCSGENPCAGCQQLQAICLYERSTRFRAGQRGSKVSSRSRDEISANACHSEKQVGGTVSTVAEDDTSKILAGQSPQLIRPGSSDYYFNLAQQLLIDPSSEYTRNANNAQSTPKMAQDLRRLIQDRSSRKSQSLLLVIPLPRWLEILDFYEEEIGLLYPFLDVTELRNHLRDVSSIVPIPHVARQEVRLGAKMEEILILVLAIMAVLEEPDVSAICDDFAEQIMVKSWRRSHMGNVVDHDVSLNILMSIYYFMTDRESLAWRNIGSVIRMLQELGYHNCADLQHRFKSRGAREKAKKVLWSAYMLDRRWSFGTGLPFAIHDSDIDYDIDFMDESLSSAYLKAMVSYCRIAAEVRDSALRMPSPNHAKDSARDLLDFKIGEWRRNLPECLQFHPKMDFDPLEGIRGQYRLRLLLYLRANQMSIVIHRKSALRSGNDAIDTSSVNAMVQIAQDTIRVLVKLTQGSNIYHAQQKTFNHFLESALSALLLVTCRSKVLGDRTCTGEVQLALDIIEKLSTSSSITRRLSEKIKCFTADSTQRKLSGPTESSSLLATVTSNSSNYGRTPNSLSATYQRPEESISDCNIIPTDDFIFENLDPMPEIVQDQSPSQQSADSLPTGFSNRTQEAATGTQLAAIETGSHEAMPLFPNSFESGLSGILPNGASVDPTLVDISDTAVDLAVPTTEKWNGLLSELGDFWSDYDRMITF